MSVVQLRVSLCTAREGSCELLFLHPPAKRNWELQGMAGGWHGVKQEGHKIGVMNPVTIAVFGPLWLRKGCVSHNAYMFLLCFLTAAQTVIYYPKVGKSGEEGGTKGSCGIPHIAFLSLLFARSLDLTSGRSFNRVDLNPVLTQSTLRRLCAVLLVQAELFQPGNKYTNGASVQPLRVYELCTIVAQTWGL